MTLKTQVAAVIQQMVDVVLAAAAERGTISMQTHYGDGNWAVTVYPDGRVLNDGYAEESRGRTSRIDELTPWELAQLIETLI